MSLTIIIGAAASGKSNLLVSGMAERSLALPEDKFFAIVPEQATLNMQQSVVRHVKNGATFNIDVVSFNRLAQVVFSDLGLDVSNVLDDTGKVLILRQVLEDCKEDLKVYQSKVHMPGFAQRMKSAVTELKQYGIDDNELFLMQESADRKGNRLLYSKLDDLRLITRKFDEKIKDAYRASEELLVLFAEQVKNSPRLCGSHIYLDGFTGFTPVQYRLLKELLRYAADVTVALTLPEDRIKDPCPEYDLFYLSNQTLTKLSEAAEEAGVEVSILSPGESGAESRVKESGISPGESGAESRVKESGISPGRSGAESRVKESGTEPGESGAESQGMQAEGSKSRRDNPERKIQGRIFAASDIDQEVTFAAKEILRLVKEEGLRYREIAVITSDMESYHYLIEKKFHEAGIPCFIDHKSDITNNPLPRYVMAAMSLYEQRFSYESIFTWLKTGLTDLSDKEIWKIENYCLEFGIHGIRAWDNEMTKNRKLYGPEPKEDQLAEDRFAGQAWNLDEINAIRETVMESVGEFYRSISRNELPAGDFAKAIKRLFRKNNIEEKLKAEAERMEKTGLLNEQREYAQVYDLTMELLEKTQALSGERRLSVKDYLAILESGFAEIKVGLIPPTLDTLMVGDITRTRLENIKVLFLLGLDDSRIPTASASSGVFSARDREFLKAENFEIAPTAAENVCSQRFYLYLMLNKPQQRLYLTYSVSSADGEQNGPSYIMDELEAFVPGIETERVERVPEIKWTQQALKELASGLRNGPEEDLLAFFAAEDPKLLRKIVNAAFFTNVQTPLDPQVALDLYGDVLSGSVSRYEKFSECPFKQFLSYGLKLEKRPEYEIAATDVGTIYHSALELYSRKLEDSGTSYRNVSDEESRRLAEESVKEALEAMPTDILDSSARNEFFVKRITDVTIKTTDILRQQVRAGLYEPDRYELEFRNALNENVRFKGKIDRVDIYDGEDIFVKIIDYKSGQKAFKIEEIYSGLQLQLVAYLKEAIGIYSQENPQKNVYPGGVYYYLINDRFTKDEQEAGDRFKLSGLTSCEDGMLAAMDEVLEADSSVTSRIISVGKKKDGELTATSQVANNGEFRNLMDFVSGKIEEISSRIKQGEIEVHPYYEQDRKNACSWCEFRDICKFEAGSFGTDWKKKPEISKKEMEAEIYGRVQAE